MAKEISHEQLNALLIRSAFSGWAQAAEELLARGASTAAQDKEGRYAVNIALRKGYFSTAHVIETQARLECTKIPIDEIAPDTQAKLDADLIQAVKNGYKDIAHNLLGQGANPDACDEFGIPAIVLAAEEGHYAAALTLIEGGADINQQDTDGNTAIMAATVNGFDETVRRLWDRGADLTIINLDDETFADLAEFNQSQYIREFFLDTRHSQQPEAFQHPLRTRSIARQEILNKVAGVKISDAEHEDRQSLRHQLSDHAKSAIDQDLLRAALYGDFDGLEEALTKGANPDAQNAEGHTALTLASKQGFTQCVYKLLEGWANPLFVTSAGEIPLAEAIKAGHLNSARAINRYLPEITENLRVVAREACQIATRRQHHRTADFARLLVNGI
ncbi:MAG: ankyrin repeat domain-containing protein [Alphaproteobacteria bacterium]